MNHRKSVGKTLLALLLCVGLLGQMGAVAWATESSLPEEGMLAAQENVADSAAEADASEAAGDESAAAQSEETGENLSVVPEEAEAQPESQEAAQPEAEAEEERRSGGEGESISSPEFWEEFHEEYAEDGEYLKRFELYQEQGVKRAFEDDDDIPGTIEALSAQEVEALESNGGTTKSPFTGKTYTHAASKKGIPVVLGIDVSKWQDSINWDKVKAAGVEFVFLRCGYTNVSKWKMNKDERFDTFITGAHNAGIPIGIYYFSQATSVSEAQSEANKTLELIEPYRSWITLPVVMDIETGKSYRINKVSRAQGTLNVQAYCDIIANSGYSAYYYGNPNDLASMCDVAQLGSYGCWLARYATSTTYSGAYDFWQYSSSGKVSGISGGVDCNFWYKGEGVGGSSSGKPGQVVGLSCTATGDTWLDLKWDAVSNAQSYSVEGMAPGGSYEPLATSVGNTCRISNLSPSTQYSVRVKGVNTKGSGTASAAITVTTASGDQNRYDLAAPALAGAWSEYGGVRVRWQTTDGAQMFRVLRKDGGSDWIGVGETTELSFLDTSAQDGVTYTYTVRCINASDRSDAGAMDESGRSITYHAAPTIYSAVAKGKSVNLAWLAGAGVQKTRVFRKEGSGSWKTLATVSSASYTDKSVKVGAVYSYTVRSVSDDGGSYLSGYNPTGVQVCVINTPKLSSVKNSKKGALTAKWSKVNLAQGYQVRFVLGSKVITKTVKGVKKTKVTVKKLTKKQTYKVSVRSWRKVGGKTRYSAWSAEKSVKVSK